MPATDNPLINDRDVQFVLYELLDVEQLCKLRAFQEHSRETFDLVLHSSRRVAREVLFPAYRPMDESPAVYRDGTIHPHPRMREILPKLLELGLISMSRPPEVGGQQIPLAVGTMVQVYLGAANCAATGYIGLTLGAAHLIEAFGDAALKRDVMPRLYSGEWLGTMALTEPQAGSSLADVATTAHRASDGTYRLRGSKIFISAGDHDLTENIVHMTLARIEGAPPGIKGVSLFAVPKRRHAGDRLIPNDVATTGTIHKIGWKGLASVALSFGDQDDCHGWIVGEPNRGISYMFQMMNEARIMVGASGAATASAAYHEAVAYARSRPQGRAFTSREPSQPQIAIIEHPDVRRMLLRMKAIVDASLSLAATTAMYADLAAHGADDSERQRAKWLLDLLTPVTKAFPSEKGFEANVLAIQVHGGYGYSSEYLPESWMRDQKLNSLHEGTTGIQGMDLLGRKVVADGGNALRAFGEEVAAAVIAAREAGVDGAWCDRLDAVSQQLGALTLDLAQSGLSGDVERMMLHSTDYLDLFSTVVIAWQWLRQATAAKRGLDRGGVDAGFYQGKLHAAQYWFATELTRFEQLAELCRSAENSYLTMQPDWF